MMGHTNTIGTRVCRRVSGHRCPYSFAISSIDRCLDMAVSSSGDRCLDIAASSNGDCCQQFGLGASYVITIIELFDFCWGVFAWGAWQSRCRLQQHH